MDSSNKRTLMVLPRMKDLYNALYDRIYMVLDNALKGPFTIFLMAMPRVGKIGDLWKIDREEDFELNYVGLDRQFELLKHNNKKLAIEKAEADFKILAKFSRKSSHTRVSLITEDQIEGKSRLSNLPKGSLKKYFENPDEYQEAEKGILEQKFKNIDEMFYFSVPLIQFGEIDGQIHFILNNQDFKKFTRKKKNEEIEVNVTFAKKIIKAIIREYEGILLDWEVEGEYFKVKRHEIRRVTDENFDKELQQRLNDIPILKELGLKEYYELHRAYFKLRFELSDNIPAIISRQYLLTAIMAIMIESFAHNISAHSLTALEWWFRQRSLHDKLVDNLKDNLAKIIPKKVDSLLVHEIHTTIRYLQDKGAFWTGLTREKNFGGKISSLYSILYYGFARNSLLFGTIAFSEGILKIKIKVSILQVVPIEKIGVDAEDAVVYKKIKKCTGHFATIDLKEFYDSVKNKKDMDPQLFVSDGNEFTEIKEELKKIKAFFPGSVVGQHAFYSIIENELRNVKHFPEEVLENMINDGLVLHISIEEQFLKPATLGKDGEYLLMGVWLEHPVAMDEKRLVSRLERINAHIIDENTNRPRLGGSAQDKICAAFLMNNSFNSVERKETDRDKRFYPWIKLGTSFLSENEHHEFEDIIISARRYSEENDFPISRAIFKAKLEQPRAGYFKKFFHLWKGENVYSLNSLSDLSEEENVARFRFVNINKIEIKDNPRQRVREEGVIRVINSPGDLTFIEAYRIWLKEWIGDNFEYQIQFYKNADPVGFLNYQNGQVSYYNKTLRKKKGIKKLDNPNQTQKINLEHGTSHQDKDQQKWVRYRSNGVFVEYFLNRPNHIAMGEMEEPLAAELFEVLATKMIIFDHRIAERLEHVNQQILHQQLLCEAYREKVAIWNEQKALGFDRFNIMVLHLSFIESFVDEQNLKMYSEEDIKKFLDDELFSNPKLRQKENFLLVITTGRGRTQWWEKLKEDKAIDYTSRVTFRPVEAILATIEDAFSIQDDIELKYRLIKILFGS